MKPLKNWNLPTMQRFRAALLRWYRRHQRALPWRADPTPYRVWISEIMLQQTQVKTVIPYYDRFMKQFPDIESLARAREREVLELWSGLGYYSRARNLHRAAQQIAQTGGTFPKQFKDILALPGIGRYTAGAISSIAFNQAEPAVDGNVRRVLSRLNGIQGRVPESYFRKQISAWIPEKKASSFNQAMMEVGALICLPFRPLCSQCPVKVFCRGRRLGIQNSIPRARARQASRLVHIVTLVLNQDGAVLLTSSNGLHFIPGKWGLPSRLIFSGESEMEAARILCRSVLGHCIPLESRPPVRHSISSRRMIVHVYCGVAGSSDSGRRSTNRSRWLPRSSGKGPLISSLFRKVLEKCG